MKNKKRNSGLLLAMPAIIGFLIFYLIPFLITVWYSVSFGVGAGEFVGMENYRMIFQNEMFLQAAGNTIQFLGVGIPLILALSFFLALLLQMHLKGNRFFQLSFLYPLMLPVASTVMFARILFEENGLINHWIVKGETDWLYSPYAFWILIALFLWKNTGYHVLIFLSGLKMIPREYYESAMIDGAGTVRLFRSITFPLMLPILGFNFLLAMMNSFKSFREALLIGGTHPHKSIYMLQHFMNNNFENLNYQKISVTSVLMFLVVLAVLIIGLAIRKGYGRRNG